MSDECTMSWCMCMCMMFYVVVLWSTVSVGQDGERLSLDAVRLCSWHSWCVAWSCLAANLQSGCHLVISLNYHLFIFSSWVVDSCNCVNCSFKNKILIELEPKLWLWVKIMDSKCWKTVFIHIDQLPSVCLSVCLQDLLLPYLIRSKVKRLLEGAQDQQPLLKFVDQSMVQPDRKQILEVL